MIPDRRFSSSSLAAVTNDTSKTPLLKISFYRSLLVLIFKTPPPLLSEQLLLTRMRIYELLKGLHITGMKFLICGEAKIKTFTMIY